MTIKMIVPAALEFKVLSVDDQYGCNDKTNSHRHLDLSFDELKDGKQFKDKFECITIVKWWPIKTLQNVACCSS
jgi:hypothetical protein